MPRQPKLTGLPGFDEFWAMYPKREGKKDAQDLWVKLEPSPVLVETMLTALAWQKQQPKWLKNGGMYIPMPETWLRGARWEDEPPPTVARRGVLPVASLVCASCKRVAVDRLGNFCDGCRERAGLSL